MVPCSFQNSHSNPRLPIDANQIKWFKTHILFLDFDWCPIEVMFTLPIKWNSIGSLGWIALPPRSSLMKCEASNLRRGWVERNSFPSWPNSESFIWPTELHILFHYAAMNILEFFFLEIRPLSSWAWNFITKIMLLLDISEAFCAKSLRVLQSS